ncbi:SHOCT domain-containing protein [Alkaliphilus sp. B6464]|uniref:SHOCT domain-containing protein n=1 Tax=Alkaliphilus sp. B6464 TaxID=2731219 RepID=UPI002ED34E15
MDEKIFNNEKLYGITMAIAKAMLNKNLITYEEYKIIDKEMLKKYNPIFSTLIASIP